MDVVGYSKLLINQQSDLLQRLNHIVRGTEQFRRAEAAGKLVRLPTGDGMSLVFFTSPDAPVRCAREISAALRSQPDFRLRMGIHSGPVDAVSDVNDRANVAGAGINLAQRVMDCGDAGHILLSQRVADDLNQYAEWKPHLHELGEVEVKHGVKVSVVNFFSGDAGNPELPESLRRITKIRATGLRRRRIAWALGSLFVTGALALGFWFQGLRVARTNLPASVFPEKSIAVLPLANLSEKSEDAFFADGIQDDILTSLAKISDLKVISRTSVMQYRGQGAARNLREIAQALGVENILEGSVRRAGNRVLVNVQLIDARNDRHIWAERYDRTITDSIGLQGELATEIAGALRSTLAPAEKASLQAKPTKNPEAYLLYLRARDRAASADTGVKEAIAAEDLYTQAIALDPTFALAHAEAAAANIVIFGNTGDEARKEKARTQAEEALRLSPALGEAHFALGLCLYYAEKDFEGALKQFAIAEKTSPNNAQIVRYTGVIYRVQGRWRESIASYKRALNLDPRNTDIAKSASLTYMLVRDWPAAAEVASRALEIEPNSVQIALMLGTVEWLRDGNLAAARALLRKLPSGFEEMAFLTWEQCMLERDFAAAEKALDGFPSEKTEEAEEKSYCQAFTALARGDVRLAHRLFETVRPSYEVKVRDHPDDADDRAELGLLYAYLGRKEDAVREGRHAVDLAVAAKNPRQRAALETYLALVHARTGDIDEAITLIERLLTTPGAIVRSRRPSVTSITLMDLRFRCEWDPLRSNPRFKKILAGPEPKTIY
jgi:serine/threonine-protein kinase